MILNERIMKIEDCEVGLNTLKFLKTFTNLNCFPFPDLDQKQKSIITRVDTVKKHTSDKKMNNLKIRINSVSHNKTDGHLIKKKH